MTSCQKCAWPLNAFNHFTSLEVMAFESINGGASEIRYHKVAIGNDKRPLIARIWRED
jgi:hypothetical protein